MPRHFGRNIASHQMTNGKKFNLFATLKGLLGYCKNFAPWIVIAVIFATVGAILNVIGPSYLQRISDIIKDALDASIHGLPTMIDLQAVWDIAIVLILFYAIGALLNLLNSLIMTQVTQRTTRRMRNEISAKINRLPLKYLDSHSYGDTLSRVTNDVDMIGQSLNNSVTTLVTSIAMFVGSLVMMFITNWIMAITAIVASILGFLLMGVIIKVSQKHFVKQQQSLGALNGHVESIYTGHDIVNVYNGQKEAKNKFEKYNQDLYTSGWKSQFLSGLMMPLMVFIGNFGYVAVAVVGAILMVNHMISLGVITAFIIYIRLFTQPLSQMAQAFTSLQTAGAASDRVFEILNEQEMSNEGGKIVEQKKVLGNVEFEHVKFGYDADNLIIKDFSLTVKAGQKVAIVGPTGAGKTTLVNLLMRFYDVNEGDIKIDGTSVRDMTREQVHDMFGMVLQDTWMFNGTIIDNIVYNKVDVSRADVVDACKKVGLDHFIRSLPHGYDTIIDENTTISAGQKQLLTIARAMVQNNPMLILDEATSSVDTRTEILIQEAMDKLSENRTSFVIAHRLSTIKNADMIIVMKNGDVVESGTHAELLAQNGAYAELYNSQFEEV